MLKIIKNLIDSSIKDSEGILLRLLKYNSASILTIA